MPFGMVRRPNQGAAFDKVEPFLQTNFLILGEFVGMHKLRNIQVHFGGLQVLPDRKDITAVFQ